MFKLRRLRCSFCGKSEADVAKLVAGRKVYICDQCVAVASKIMESFPGDSSKPSDPHRSLLQRVVHRMGQALLRGPSRRSECHAVTGR